MTKKNKIYWLEGVTKNEVENSLASTRYKWIRKQSHRRILVLAQLLFLAMISTPSYWKPIQRTLNFDLNSYSVILMVVFFIGFIGVVSGYSLLKTIIRHIADAPGELLDERQIGIRNGHYRTAYAYSVISSLIFMAIMMFGPELNFMVRTQSANDGSWLLISYLLAVTCIPTMVVAWSERNV